MIINAIRVKIKIVNFTTFSFLFRNKFAKIGFLIKNRVYLKYIYNDIVIIDKLINVYNDNYDDNARQVEKEIAINSNDKNATLIIINIL